MPAARCFVTTGCDCRAIKVDSLQMDWKARCRLPRVRERYAQGCTPPFTPLFYSIPLPFSLSLVAVDAVNLHSARGWTLKGDVPREIVAPIKSSRTIQRPFRLTIATIVRN